MSGQRSALLAFVILNLCVSAVRGCHEPDNEAFVDEDGWSCDRWDSYIGSAQQGGYRRTIRMYDCYGGFAKWKYTAEGAIAVLKNCPRACAVCDYKPGGSTAGQSEIRLESVAPPSAPALLAAAAATALLLSYRRGHRVLL